MKWVSTDNTWASRFGPSLKVEVKRFASGELSVHLTEDVVFEDVVILHRFTSSPQESLFELLAIADAARGASRIIAVIPYLPYTRDPKTLQCVARLLENIGITHIITVDLGHLECIFRLSVSNISPFSLILPYIHPGTVIVAPDLGAVSRAHSVANMSQNKLAIMTKVRNHPIQGLIGDVEGQDCFLVDDVIETGETLREAARFLKKNGASSIHAFVTHNVGNIETIPNIDVLWISDTIPSKSENILCVDYKIRKVIEKI